jgi:amino acid adenylation domain-containing protein
MMRILMTNKHSNNTIDKRKQLAALLAKQRLRSENVELKQYPVRETAPLTSGQQRLWYLNQLNQQDGSYNITASFQIVGHFDSLVARQALEVLLLQQPDLNTIFTKKDDTVVQSRHAIAEIEMQEVDLTNQPHLQKEPAFKETQLEFFTRGFDLSSDHLLRARWVQYTDLKGYLLLSLHHIVADGWSIDIIYNTFLRNYETILAGGKPDVTPVPLTCFDYAQWERDWLLSNASKKQLEYWKQSLKGAPQLHSLALDFPRPKSLDSAAEAITMDIPKEELNNIKAALGPLKVSLFTYLHCCYAITLATFSDQEDIVVAVPTATRDNPKVANLVGFLVNTLPQRVKVDRERSIVSLMSQVAQVNHEAQSNKGLPFDYLIEQLGVPRSQSHAPMVQLAINMIKESDLKQPDSKAFKISIYDGEVHSAKFELTLTIRELADSLQVEWCYNSSLFSQSSIAAMCQYFMALTQQIALNPEATVNQIEPQMSLQALSYIEGGHRALSERRVEEAFAKSFAKNPTGVAVASSGIEKTFQELQQESEQIATKLREIGVMQGQRIALCFERKAEYLSFLLGVLKAKCAFVPMDPETPHERRQYMLENSAASLLICSDDLQANVSETANKITSCTVSEFMRLSILSGPKHEPDEEEVAYIIYTSGSTGKPKGVRVSHQSLLNLVLGNEYIDDDMVNGVMAASNFAFDGSIFDIFYPLLNGKLCYILPKEYRLDPHKWISINEKYGIDCGLITTALFNVWANSDLDVLASYKQILFGGEKANLAAISRVLEKYPQLQLIHAYGPSEATVYATYEKLNKDNAAQAPIGRPISNYQISIRNQNMQVLPRGAMGELYISGDGVALGYQNAPELTARNFVEIEQPGQGVALCYRTGDKVRINARGSVEFCGRIDGQIKLRGFRIELEEITSQFASCASLSDVTVLLHTETDESFLVGYVAVGNDELPNEQQRQALIKQFTSSLAKSLPEYMVPQRYGWVKQFPINTNGKIDKKSLQQCEFTTKASTSYRAPVTPKQKSLCELWQSILNTENVGLDDNFFDLGGHSLKATRLLSAIRTKFGKDIQLKAFFEAPTVMEISQLLEDSLEIQPPSFRALRYDQKPVPSFSQQRILFIENMMQSAGLYNICGAYILEGQVDKDALKMAFEHILQRHNILRTQFYHQGGDVAVRLNHSAMMPWRYEDLQTLSGDVQTSKVEQLLSEEQGFSFDLGHDVLLRATLLHLSCEKYLMILNIHHIASDGWSMGILTDELSTLYNSIIKGDEPRLPKLSTQYQDFAAWQKEAYDNNVFASQIDYWRSQLAGIPAVHSLPLDFPRPETQQFAGDVYEITLSESVLPQLHQVCRREGVTLFMLLQTAFAVLLSRFSTEHDIVMGTPIAGREHQDLEELIGFFVNTLVLRSNIDKGQAFTEVLQQNKEMILAAYSNQQLPFDVLVEQLNPERTSRYNPLFQVMFALQNVELSELSFEGIKVSESHPIQSQSKFDLTLTAVADKADLSFNFEFNTTIFARQSIVALGESLETLLLSICDDVSISVGLLDILPIAQKQVQLKQWFGNDNTNNCNSHSIVAAWHKQVMTHPDKIAAADADNQMTFAELDQFCTYIAMTLQDRGIEHGDKVGVCLPRNCISLAIIYAVLKTGATYVPLDTSAPDERLAYIIQDAGLNTLLTDQIPRFDNIAPQLEMIDSSVLSKACFVEDKHIVSKGFKSANIKPQDNAYIIYTSGSTGQPKGVCVSHGAVLSIASGNNFIDLSRVNGAAGISSFAFDGSVFDIFYTLLNGKHVFLTEAENLLGDESCLARLKELGTSTMFVTTAMFNVLVQEKAKSLQCFKQILFGGEMANTRLVGEALEYYSDMELYHVYGPTESTVFATVVQLDKELAVTCPIGIPLPNRTVYILDELGNLLPIGAKGELFIGGKGLAEGYHGQEAMTNERFISDPFSEADEARLYRTGDLVRFDANGNIQYCGRMDNQIKRRGFRIELEEIDAHIKKITDVKDTKTLFKREDGSSQSQLLSYLIMEDGASDKVAFKKAVMEQIKSTLPAYMQPDALIVMDNLPLNQNQKVDQKALPVPTHEDFIWQQYVASETPTQCQLVDIWQQLLGLDKIGIEDKFFELGGDSLLTMKLQSRLMDAMGVRVSIRNLFDFQTIRRLAEFIDTLQRHAANSEEGNGAQQKTTSILL